MPHGARLCPFRKPTVDPELAECQRLAELSGVVDGTLCRVHRDLCAACFAATLPGSSRLNPALASRLHDLARQVIASGGVPGCTADRAGRLLGWAEDHLTIGQRGGPTLHVGGRHVPPGRSSPPRVGLVGWNTPSGLGQLNRDIARRLAIVSWLIPSHARLRQVADPPGCRVIPCTDPRDVDAFLDGLDWLLFCEQPLVQGLVAAARERGIRVAMVPMWEYVSLRDRWLRDVELMLCPTRACHDLLLRWRAQLATAWELAYVPWPIDLGRFPFRERSVCRKFLYVHGHGGARPRGGPEVRWDGRKGASIVAEAARLAPEVPVIVRTQTRSLPLFPPNVVVRHADLDDPRALYDEGDVCIQPSRWEGIGLCLLESQACGLPLITTDAPPMNEYQPLRLLPCVTSRTHLAADHAIDRHDADPAALAGVLRALHGADIHVASRAARAFVEERHSWPGALGRGPASADWPLHPRVEPDGHVQAG